MPKILLVRLSSMGDVIHNFPAVTELAQHFPEAELHWVVEEGFAALPALHPAVSRVIPIALRRWRKSIFQRSTRQEIADVRRTLQGTHYDLVIDSQCLIKSALVARLPGAPVAGMDWPSSREHLASLLYHRRIAAPWSLHAVERYRLLTAGTMGYTSSGPVDYGMRAPDINLPWRSASPYAVFLTATSRDDKLWPEADWVALGLRLIGKGLGLVLPWGNPTEQARAQRIAAALPGAVVAPKMSLGEAARLLADAQVAVGVDTGLAHLAAAVNTPIAAIYTSTDPSATGVLAAQHAINLGGIGFSPDVDTVYAAVEALLA
ncbi:MAG: lipopolysaccharide heptosyltransferase I [Burkholderiales bacterium]|nr:lipopolysaccharide heptosyltransferase I [Burkholderiales bacterium]